MTGGGCVSSPQSSRTCPTSKALQGFVRSRPVRILLTIVFAVAILTPAIAVFAVVWTTNQAPPTAVPVDTQPFRLLPAPDAQAASLPSGPENVYANTMSGVVPCPQCQLTPRVYVPNSSA